tara:strand:+ start:52 stop:192 length:141 start_codon:yes stop_codon:yes gene_type:complete
VPPLLSAQPRFEDAELAAIDRANSDIENDSDDSDGGIEEEVRERAL